MFLGFGFWDFSAPANPIVMLTQSGDGKGEGRMERMVVAEGFEDPVMGMLVKAGKLWATANNYLYLFDIGPDGKALIENSRHASD